MLRFIWILTYFWRIIDVEKMILKTEDPPEDICHHAQSQILSDISRTDMKEFMESFNGDYSNFYF